MANNQIALLAQAPELDTPYESQGKALQLRQLMNAGMVQDMDMQQKRQAIADDTATRDIYAKTDDPAERIKALYKVNPKAAQAAQKAQFDLDKIGADVSKTKAETVNEGLKGVNLRLQQARDLLGNVGDQQSAARWVQGLYADKDIGQFLTQHIGPVEQTVSKIPDPRTDPAGFASWKQASQLSAEKLVAQTSPDANARLSASTSIATNAATNATSRANNQATVGASYANAAATREIAKSTRDAAGIQRDQATEMKLGDDYRAQSKDFKAVNDAYRQINSTLDKATTSPAATLAAATKFMKLLDPGSVVRESELGMALAATGVIDRATNYFNTLQSGKVLTKNQVQDFKNITQQIYGAAQSGQQALDANYRNQAKAYNLRPEMIVQDLGQNAKPQGSGKAGASSVMDQADAILGRK